MKAVALHVQTLFYLISKIKRKKLKDYLFTIYDFAYLCIEFYSVT